MVFIQKDLFKISHGKKGIKWAELKGYSYLFIAFCIR
jgi:hypothetical protein